MFSTLAVYRSRTTSLLPSGLRSHCSRSATFVRQYSDAKSGSSESTQEQPKEEAESSADAASAETATETALKKAEAEAADLLSRLRYLQADFLNLQRNSAREREKTKDFAITNFASDLLETVDVLSLALKSIPSSALEAPDAAASETASESSSTPNSKTSVDYLRELHTGVEITQRQLLQTLFKYHVKPFDPTGDAFDPNRHEALYQAPIPGKTPGTVIDCQKTGYTIRDRVLRAAQVGVAQDAT